MKVDLDINGVLVVTGESNAEHLALKSWHYGAKDLRLDVKSEVTEQFPGDTRPFTTAKLVPILVKHS